MENTDTAGVLTPNQLVSYNLWRIRLSMGITQAEAAERLEPHLGVRWSKATFSAAERSWGKDDRVRQFTADDIAALARAFDVPIISFFLPPATKPPTRVAASRGLAAISAPEFLELLLGAPEADGTRKVEAIIETLLDQAVETTDSQEALRGYAERAQARALRKLLGDLGAKASALRELAALLEEAEEATIDDEMDRRRQETLGDEL